MKKQDLVKYLLGLFACVYVKKILPVFLFAGVALMLVSFIAVPCHNGTGVAKVSRVSDSALMVGDSVVSMDDSLVSVIAWFNKRDTMTYWIHEGRWTYNGEDTVLTAGMHTKVMVTVTDSTEAGYRMEYRFLEFKMDSTIEKSWMLPLLKVATDKFQHELVGTSIKFRTDECGKIIKYDNLGKIKRQAKRLFPYVIKNIPNIDSLAVIGLDLKPYLKTIDGDQLVKGYIEELEMLFGNHGSQFNIREIRDHEDATEDQYESDSYTAVRLDRESGDYEIEVDINNYIPKEAIKNILNGLVDMFLDKGNTEDIKNDLDDGLDEHLTEDAVYNTYLRMKYFADGWPKEIVSQKKSSVGKQGRLEQKYIEWIHRSVGHTN